MIYGLRDLFCTPDKKISLRPHEFWALENISFTLKRGQSLGIVGPNGSGKTTLLKLISEILLPSQGSITHKGKITSLLELQAGLNPNLTGRENIQYYYLLHGFTKKQIKEIEPQIIAFAELEEFIDSPLYIYSLGMQARLGFSCALFTKPDILLIDEVFSVGDLRFKGKGHRMITQLKEAGTSFIIVSHHSQAIINMCDSALLLWKGQQILTASPQEVIRTYEEKILGNIPSSTRKPQNTEPTANIVVTDIFFEGAQGERITEPISGDFLQICIELSSSITAKNISIFFHVYSIGEFSEQVLLLNTYNKNEYVPVEANKKTVCRLKLSPLVINPGQYSILIHVRKNSTYTFTSVSDYFFTIKPRLSYTAEHNKFFQPHTWSYEILK